MSDWEIIAYTAAALVALPVAAVMFVIVMAPIVLVPGAVYSWLKHPEYRPAAVEARTRAAQQQLAERLSGGRRRAFLRRRAERQAKLARANPWQRA